MTTIEDENGYAIAEKYLRKKYGNDYTDFIEIEGQSYLDGYEQGYEDCRHYAHDYYKPKWHEVESHVKSSREIEKQYMPKAGEKVLLKYHFYNDEEVHYSDGYYDNYDFEFHITNNATGKVICVIAWCKLEEE